MMLFSRCPAIDMVSFITAAAFLQHNVIVLIDGSDSHSRACALSTVTNIPLIRLHGNGGSFKQCDRAIQMSVGYKDYAHATFDLLNTFGWRSVVLVFKGNCPLATKIEILLKDCK